MARVNSDYEYQHLFEDLDDEKEISFAIESLLFQIWDGYTMADKPSFGVFCFRHRIKGTFVEEIVKITGCGQTQGLLKKYSRWDWDQYFCPNMFLAENRRKAFARNTRLAWCDIDEADPFAFRPKPSLVWETSPGRYQALWLWDKKYTPRKAEQYSRALTYRHGGDKNGWPINKLLRLPGSINHKAGYGEPFIPLLHCDLKPIKTRPRPFKIIGRSYGSQTQILEMNPKVHLRLDVLKKHRRRLDLTAIQLIRHNKTYAPDRSAQVFHMITSLHEAGATIDEIASVIWDSPYFQEKYPDDVGALNAEVSRILAKIGGAK